MSRVALVALALIFAGCTHVRVSNVDGDLVTVTDGKPIAIIEADSVGFSLFLNLITVRDPDLEGLIKNVLVKEAQGMAASKVKLLSASSTPRTGIYSIFSPAPPWFCLLFCFPTAHAVGVALE